MYQNQSTDHGIITHVLGTQAQRASALSGPLAQRSNTPLVSKSALGAVANEMKGLMRSR